MSSEKLSDEAQSSYSLAVFGGCYNNYLALQATLDDAYLRGASVIYCLGDMGGFGPYPDRIFSLLWKYEVICIQGNYDHSVGNRLADCGCGYTDPRDNYYAQISYDYTLAKTADRYKDWLRNLPSRIQLHLANQRILMVHGSPRRVNEFLWESTTPDPFLAKLFTDYEADIILCTHTGIQWQRQLPDGQHIINVGGIGRPPNDGQTTVWYALLTVHPEYSRIECELLPVAYDHERLAYEMRKEELPEEFAQTILTGWWTTCLEILPARERALGGF
ncbi:MAG TPA: metallophosphoesterase family protein [Ktedonobacteraceae bacterium]|nr:metallophosphoesterase family protein [Ktedonobacteraceae bacterium]